MATDSITALSSCLLETEIAALAPNTRAKLEEAAKTWDRTAKEAKTAVEKLRVVSEQQCFNLEKQLLENIEKLNVAHETVQVLETKNAELDTKLKSCTSELEDCRRTSSDFQKQLQELKSQNELLCTEKTDLLSMLDKRTREGETLSDDYKSVSAQLGLLTAEKYKALAKIDELTSQDGVLQQHVSRLEQEKGSLLKQMEHLNVELSQSSHRLYATRSEQGHKVVELQGKLDDIAEQLRLAVSVKESYQKIVEEQNEKLEGQSQQLKQLRETHIKADEQYQHQLQMQSKLAELYKSSLEESQGRVKELMSAVEEMQMLLKQAAEESKSHEEEFVSMNARWESTVSKKDEQMSRLKNDLLKMESILDQTRKQMLTDDEVSGLSPAAAAASRLLKSGKSLTEIYGDYVGTLEELQTMRVENERLNMYLNQILKEIEGKAPALKKQKEDYEKSLETITLLTGRLNAAIADHDKMGLELSEFRQKFLVFHKEKDTSEKSLADLSQQVCVLLREVEIASGRNVRSDVADSSGVVSSSTASAVITENLVTFKNIQDLQSQNQNLLTIVRELGEKHEQDSAENADKRIVAIQNELKAALQEVEELRMARDRQKDMVEAIVRQRDMYRVLLGQANQSILSGEVSGPPAETSAPVTATSPPKVSMEEHSTVQSALHQLQEEYSNYKAQSAENTKVLQEQVEQLKNDRMELRLQGAKMTSQLEFLNERYNTMRVTVDGYRKEVSALVTRNQQLLAMTAKHEESVGVLRNELMSCQEKLSKAQVTLENTQLERALLQQTEVRLKTENEILRREQCGQAMLMANLQAIQNNLEKSDSEAKMQLHNRISLLEKELSASRNKFDRELGHSRTMLESFEKERQQLQKNIQAEIAKHSKTRDDLVAAYGSLHEARQEVLFAGEKLKAIESMIPKETNRPRAIKLARPDAGQSEKEDGENSLLLAEAQAEARALKSQLELAQQHLNQFKSIATSLEEQIKEQSETNVKLQTDAEKSLKEKTEVVSSLTKELECLKVENAAMSLEVTKKYADNSSQVEELRKELSSVRHELHEAVQLATESRRKEEAARSELLVQAASIEEERHNYQRELMLHASDVNKLESLQSEMNAIGAKLAAAEEASRKAEFALKSNQASWESREVLMKRELEQLTTKCAELEQQNKLLHEQMEKMSDQMVGIQAKMTTTDEAKFAASEVDGNSNDQLLEIIKFLRKERDIANAKCELATAESQRLSSKVTFLQTRLDEASSSLAEIQQKEQATLLTSSQHNELLRKVELLNVLTDGNRLLRDDKKQLEETLKEMEAKFVKLESEILPLQTKNKELVEQCDVLQTERKALEGEARRWQARTHQLTSMRSEKESVQSELRSSKEELARVTEDLGSKDSQIAQLNRNLLQVRKIGRKYKSQFDEVKADYDALLAKQQELEAKVAAKSAEPVAEPVPNLAEVVEATKVEMRKEMDAKVEEHVKASDEKIKQLRQSAYHRISRLTGERDERLKEIQDLKSKLAALEQAQQTDVSRAEEARSQFELRIKELESKLEESRAATKTTIQNKVALEKDIEGMTLKLSVQQKFIETLQAKLKDTTNIKLSAVTSSSRESSSSVDSGTPPTANIKPMATTPGATVVRHSLPVNPPSRPTPMGRIRPITSYSQSARMAAVPPTTASSALSQQQELPEESTLSVSSTSTPVSVPQATVAPTPAVVAVSALSTATETSPPQQQQQHHHVSTFTEPQPSTFDDADSNVRSSEVSRDVSVSGSISDSHLQSQEAHSSSDSCEITGASSEPLPVGMPIVMKRPRVEDSSEGDSNADRLVPKKAKTDIDESEGSPSKTVCQSSTVDVPETKDVNKEKEIVSDKLIPQVKVEKSMDDEAELEVITVESDEDEVAGEDEEEEGPDGGDIAEEDEMEGPSVDSRMGDDYDEDEDFPEEEEEEEEEEERDKMDRKQFQDGGEGIADDDNDVEILEQEGVVEVGEEMVSEEPPGGEELPLMDDRSDGGNLQAASEPAEQQPFLVQPLSTPVQRQGYVPRVPLRADRIPTLGGQQPAPFPTMGANSSGGFEDGDSIVPSTPTLFDPRRNDGFAEAVSSPQVPPERFLFGSGVETPSQLASQALGVDDTRMDLSQLDESSGRSVPSTPLQVSPPGNLESEAVPDDGVLIAIQEVSDAVQLGIMEEAASEGDVSIVVEESPEVQPGVGQEATSEASGGPIIVAVTSEASECVVREPTDVVQRPVSPAFASTSSATVPVGGATRSNRPQSYTPARTGSPSDNFSNQRRATPIIWDRPRGGPVSRGRPPFGHGGSNGNRPYIRRMRVMGHPMRMGRQFRGGGGNRGQRYPRMK